MERRLLTFIVASTAFFLIYFSLRAKFGPQRPPAAAQLAEREEGLDADPLDAELAGDADATSESDPSSTEGADPSSTEGVDDPSVDRPAGDEPQEEQDSGPSRSTEPEWRTLGSMDPTSGYYMLATFNSRGAGIERIELTERNKNGSFKYRRVDVRSGYLGYFAGETYSEANGVLVNVVGPGTPADVAGIQVGDIIISVNGNPTVRRADITEALLTTESGDKVAVEVIRGDDLTPLTLSATLTNHPLDLVRLAEDGGIDEIKGNLSRLSCLVTLSQINRKSILPSDYAITGLEDPSELIWTADEGNADSDASLEYSLDMTASEMKAVGGQRVRFRRSYTLTPGSYALDMSIQIDNLGGEAQDIAYRLEGVNGLTLEGWWYSTKISPNFSGAAARDVVYKTQADGHQLVSGYDLLKRAKKEEKDPNQTLFAPDGDQASRNMKYIGVDAQYFTVAYVPTEGDPSLQTFRRASAGIAAKSELIPRHKEQAVNSTFFLDSIVQSVPAGGSLRQDLRLFAGPKQPELLAQYELGDCIYYGWFSGLAKILASLLHLLSGIGNYAVAIVLLTVIVRGGMFPLSRKAAVNAQKMQELAPELKKINERYKDDMEGKLKAQRELQQRVGFNPLAGCLPMFLQLPIFIGLYRALSVDIELRQAVFSSRTDWASNLAGPDMFAYWGDWLWDYLSGRGTGWLGPYFNILPVLVVVLFLAQQKMFMPPATDEQTAMTQKMMNIMTLMMGLFFFRVPAGLCIYFITSSLWGICERMLVKKTLPDKKHFDASVLEGTAAATDGSSQSLVNRIRSQVAKPEPPIERPNKRRRPNKKKKN